MNLQVLGCGGGIGGRESWTTSLLVDDDILIDAGTGVGRLGMDELTRIDHVFLTHSHVDHIVGLAFLADAVLGRRAGALTVHATERSLDALRKHLFNWVLWPDFSVLPTKEDPTVRWQVLEPHVPIDLGTRTIVAHPVNHTVEGVAYVVTQARSGFLFTGDTATCPALWSYVAGDARLSAALVDCSFPDADADIATASRHYCPSTLLADIGNVPAAVRFLVTHLKPGSEEDILDELRANGVGRAFSALRSGDRFTF
jgi:3',5'-cyclic-nucleotide phosphodiesterase